MDPILTPRPRTSQSIYEDTGLEDLMEKMTKAESEEKMTFWSRHDPINMPRGNTDHWAKCRQRSGNYKVTYGATGLNMCPDAELDFLNQRPKSMSNVKGALRSSYNSRAKEGFRYWLIEKPKPTKFGKYGIGSYKTVLGIGNAPRT